MRERTQGCRGWTLNYILRRLGIARSRYHAWQERMARAHGKSAWQEREARDALADCSTAPTMDLDTVLTEEKQAVKEYALQHPKDGYRRLAWQMVDADVAFLSASSVYRVLSEADLLYRWKRSTHSGTAPEKPTRPNERWAERLPLQGSRPGTRTSCIFMYLRVADTWYFLVTVLDAYSRYVVHSSCTGICRPR